MNAFRSDRNLRIATLCVGSALLLTTAACGGSGGSTVSPPGSSTTSKPPTKSTAPVPVESNPPGDIPDDLAFVKFSNAAGGYSFTHPEGWAKTGAGASVKFTDKLNGVAVQSLAGSSAPTPATARSSDVPRLEKSVPAFALVRIEKANLPAGPGVHIVFRRNSDPDPVTGKVYRDEVEEYIAFAAGRLVRMDLVGPVGADNVDAYRTMSQSLRIR